MSTLVHKCSDHDCPYFAKTSPRECICHQTEAGMKDEAIAELVAALYRLRAWGECFIKDTPITDETLWREFPDAMKHAEATLAKHSQVKP